MQRHLQRPHSLVVAWIMIAAIDIPCQVHKKKGVCTLSVAAL